MVRVELSLLRGPRTLPALWFSDYSNIIQLRADSSYFFGMDVSVSCVTYLSPLPLIFHDLCWAIRMSKMVVAVLWGNTINNYNFFYHVMTSPLTGTFSSLSSAAFPGIYLGVRMCVSVFIAKLVLTLSKLAACQRVMLTHRKDLSLFTKAPLVPYLGSLEQEFPLLISVQNCLTHGTQTWLESSDPL